MSFRDLNDEGQPSTATVSISDFDMNNWKSAAFTVQKALGDFEERADEVERAVGILGTSEDTPEHRQILEKRIDYAMDSANTTRDALQLLLIRKNTVPSINDKGNDTVVNRALHKKLRGDFERTFEQLNECTQKVLTIILPQQEYQKYGGASQHESNQSSSLIENDPTESLLQSAVEFNQQDLHDRECEFRALKRSVLQLNDIYANVAVLVESQSENINNIDAQVGQAEDRTNAGLRELLKSPLYNRRVNPVALWFFVVVAIGLVVLLVLVTHKTEHGQPVVKNIIDSIDM